MRLIILILLFCSVGFAQQIQQLWLASVPKNDPYVADWLTRVSDAGGATPSDNTIASLNSFSSTLRSTGLDAKMKLLNPLVPDSLNAAKTPLIKVVGPNTWTNVSFTDANVTVNGVVGNNSGYFQTGFIPSQAFDNLTNCGVTVYLYDTSTANHGFTFGCQTSGPTSAFMLYVSWWGQQTLWDNWNWNVRLASPVVTPPYVGYVSVNRISATSNAMFRARSDLLHYMAANSATSGGTYPSASYPAYFHSANVAGTVGDRSTDTLSFMAVHEGLTTSESEIFYNAVQALRTALGGGYR